MNKINFLTHFKPLFSDKRYKVLLSGRGSGKSFHAAVALIWYASRVKTKILCLREFMNSIGDSSKEQIEEVIELSGTRDSWYITLKSITHKITGSTFIFKGLRNNYNSLKSIPNIDIAVIEECSGLTTESINALIPTIRKQGSQIWFLGNPKDRNDPVAAMFIEKGDRPDTILIANDYRDNPFISKTILEEAELMRLDNEILYKHIYLGEYLDTANLILVNNIRKATATRLSNAKVVIGVDIARDGGDRTVIYVRTGKCPADVKIYNNMDLPKLTHELQALITKYKPERINIDSTGHGAWCADGLKSYGIDVKTVNFASSSRKPEKYGNMRSELYALAGKYFEGGGVIRPQDNDLDTELSASYYTLDNKNRVCLIPKQEIKKMIGKSPDVADAFCLSLLCDGDMFTSTKVSDAIDEAREAKELTMVSGW
jgi:phage terminase large subunit